MPVLRFAARRAPGGRIAQQSVWPASKARQSKDRLECQARRLGLTKEANSSDLARCIACAAARSVCDFA